MHLLLDTHTLIWFVEDAPQLSRKAKALVEDDENEKFISIASLWELAIKVSTGKLSLLPTYEEFVVEQLGVNGFIVKAISIEHLSVVAKLPFIHCDPFDRLIAAQSLTENMPLVSADTVFDAYGVQRLF